MFLQRGDRRINLDCIKEYKSSEKSNLNGKTLFYIEIIFIDGTKDNYTFYDNKKERDDLLKTLDNLLLTKI